MLIRIYSAVNIFKFLCLFQNYEHGGRGEEEHRTENVHVVNKE